MQRLTRWCLISSLLSFGAHVYSYDCSNLPEWQNTTAYGGGSQVVYQRNAYQANWWNQGKNPAQYSGQWQEWKRLGQCDTSPPPANQPPQISLLSPSGDLDLNAGDSLVFEA